MVAAYQQGYQLAFLGTFHDQRLDGLLDGQIELGHQFLNGSGIGGIHRLHGGNRGRALDGRGQRLRQFHIGGVVGAIGESDVVLAGLGQHMELMAGGAADGAGIGFHRAIIQTKAIKDGAVGAVHDLVGVCQGIHIGVERVSIFHDEFPRAHDAEARANLVTEFGLDLVKIGRQLFVAVQLITHHVGDHFLMGWPQAERIVVAIGNAQQFRAIGRRPAGFFPQFHGLHHRHQHFLRASPVHFLTDYLLNLAQHPQPGWQPGVKAGGQFADHAGTQHQLVAGHNGVRRGFFNGSKQILGGAHRGSSADVTGKG